MSYPPKDFIRAAEAGDRDVQYELGLIYCMMEDPKKAFYWLRQAATHGHVRAKEILHEVIKKHLA